MTAASKSAPQGVTPAEFQTLLAETMAAGGCLVLYGPALVKVSQKAIAAGVDTLNGYTRPTRRHVLASVEKAIENAIAGFDSLTDKQFKNLCDDIAIWFAEQVRKGEAEQYKVTRNDDPRLRGLGIVH